MKSLIIQTKGMSRLAALPDQITNAFEDLGKLLGSGDKVSVHLLHEEFKDKDRIKKYDLFFFECSLNCMYWHDRLDLVFRHKKKEAKVIGSVGPLSRIFMHVEATSLRVLYDLLSKCDIVMCMNRDEVRFVSDFLPKSHVVYLPVPIDPKFYTKDIDLTKKKKNRFTLCMHSDLFISAQGRRGDISTFLLWKQIKRINPDFGAYTWITHTESGFESKEKAIDELDAILKSIGISVNVQHSGGDFLTITPTTNIIIQMTLCHAQSRISMYGAAIERPVISSGINETHKFLWQNLCVDWHDHDEALVLFDRLIKDKVFYDSCVEMAKRKLEMFYPIAIKARLQQLVGRQ